MVVEVLVAVSIITVSILAAMAVAQRSVHVSRQAFHSAQSAFLLEEGAEVLRVMRDNSWANISSLDSGTDYYLNFSGNTWTLSETSSMVGIFTRTINISSVNRDSNQDISSSGTDDPQAKLVTVIVSWPEGGATVNKTLQFYIFDIFS